MAKLVNVALCLMIAITTGCGAGTYSVIHDDTLGPMPAWVKEDVRVVGSQACAYGTVYRPEGTAFRGIDDTDVRLQSLAKIAGYLEGVLLDERSAIAEAKAQICSSGDSAQRCAELESHLRGVENVIRTGTQAHLTGVRGARLWENGRGVVHKEHCASARRVLALIKITVINRKK